MKKRANKSGAGSTRSEFLARRRHKKLRKATRPVDVLMNDCRLSFDEARKILDALARRKFVILGARGQVAMHKSINKKIEAIIALMKPGLEHEKKPNRTNQLLSRALKFITEQEK